jgi:predicted transcriptional regulator
MTKRSMGELERAVMDILWDQGGWLTPGEVHQRLHDPALAYTTVMTILVRLWQKGRVERHRDGRAYAYHPVASREQYVAARMEQLLADSRDRSAVFSHFLDGMDPSDRAQLRRLLNRYRSP